MEPYIRMNTELRKKATSDFEKDLYKLMNNSVFGKTMENLRKRVGVKLVHANEEDKLRRLIASPAFVRANIFDDDLAAVQMHKSRLVLNRPIYVGMSILDLSKTLMYDFYYNRLQRQYGERCQLLYTDTDSLLLEIETEDVYEDMAKHQDLYDTSDFPKGHPLHSTENKKVLGKMKDECAGRSIAEYVGLRPKMYSILEASGKNIKKAKGVRKQLSRSTSGMSSSKRLSLRSKPSAMAWTSSGQSATASTGSTSTRCRCRPSIPSAGSQKMEWTHWPTATRTPPTKLVSMPPRSKRWRRTSRSCSAGEAVSAQLMGRGWYLLHNVFLPTHRHGDGARGRQHPPRNRRARRPPERAARSALQPRALQPPSPRRGALPLPGDGRGRGRGLAGGGEGRQGRPLLALPLPRERRRAAGALATATSFVLQRRGPRDDRRPPHGDRPSGHEKGLGR